MRLSRIPMMIALLLLGAGLVTAAGTGAFTGGTGTSVASIDDDGTTDEGPGEIGHFDDQGRPETDDDGVLSDDDGTADQGSGDALGTLDRDDRGDDDNSGPSINRAPDSTGDHDDDDDNSGPGSGDDVAVDNSGPGNARDDDDEDDEDDDDDDDTTDGSDGDDTTGDTDNSGSGSGDDS